MATGAKRAEAVSVSDNDGDGPSDSALLDPAADRARKRIRSEESSNGGGCLDGEEKKMCTGALKVRDYVLNALKKRDDCKSIFEQRREEQGLRRTELLPVLREVNASLREGDLEFHRRMNHHDLSDSEFVSLNEFIDLINAQSKVEQWACALPFPMLLANAISAVSTPSSDEDPLRAVGKLTRDQISDISQGLVEGLAKILSDRVQLLQTALDAKTEHSEVAEYSKFQVEKMNCGGLDDYHAGVEGRTGFPRMKFMEGMTSEHCERKGCDYEFETMDKTVKTTPKLEWGYVVHGNQLPFKSTSRLIHKIDDLMALDSVKEAELKREEVIAVVLYTGPMFRIYNTMLRHRPKDLFQKFSDVGNLFSTTIFVLVSALQKLLKHAPLPKGKVVYRGLKGDFELPDSFFKGDKLERKGYTEWGFMSTTSDKAVALRYSGVQGDRGCPTVMEIRVGAVDRGVCIRELSQYEAEVEYLWLPCSWLEPRGNIRLEMSPGNGGVVRIIPCDARANMKGMTTDEQVKRRKRMHLDAFKHVVDDMSRQLNDLAIKGDADGRLQRDPTWKKDKDGRPTDKKNREVWSVEKYIDRIVQLCREVWDKHDKMDADAYGNDGKFRELSLAMAESANMAESMLKYWLEDSSSHIAFLLHEYTPKRAHRERIGFLLRTLGDGEERQMRAEVLCRVKGLLDVDANEINELNEPRLVAAAADGKSPADLRLLVSAGADVNVPDDKGNTALHAAVACGHSDAVRELVLLGTDINAVEKSKGMTALFLSARYGQLECLNELIKAGADLTLCNVNMATPLYIAAQNGHAECIAALASAKADVNSPREDGVTPVWRAACEGHAACVRTLVEFGAELTTVCLDHTALGKAKQKEAQARKKKQTAEQTRFAACIEALSRASGTDAAGSAEQGAR